MQLTIIADMIIPQDNGKYARLLPMLEQKSISKCNLAFTSALAVLLLMSIVSIVSFNSMPSASATFPGTNGKIAFTSDRDDGDYEIYVMDADGSEQIRLTQSAGFDFQASWSPDGTKIVFESERDGNREIYVMNADGSEQINLTQNPNGDSGAAWSPDGKKIAFFSTRDGDTGIFVMDADGSGQTRLTTGEDFYPDWSPDGEKILFETARDIATLGYEIYVMNADGSGQTNLTNNPAFLDIRPSWSPDGNKIAFHSSRAGAGIFVMNADGSEVTQVADFVTIDAAPSWSPDGTKILYDSAALDPQFASEEIIMISSDGTGEKTNLTNNPTSDVEPDWGVQSTQPTESTLTVNSVDLSDNPINGIWTVIRSADGTILKTGYTPLTFTGDTGKDNKVSVANYDGKIFQHWEDGSTERTRTISLSQDTTMIASYDTGDTLSGFTPLTYTGAEQPDLTVNAVTIGGTTLHMWTIIDPQSSDASGTTYKVYASNYRDKIFDHWEDGSTDRIRTLTIGEATTITAYYRTGG